MKLLGNGAIIAESMEVTGSGIKYFKIPHPTKEGETLSHVAVETEKAEVYYRGKCWMSKGKYDNINIYLPDYFWELIIPETITVQATSIGSVEAIGYSIEDNIIYLIKNSDFGSIEVSWTVYAERKICTEPGPQKE